jgi:hypothetical protein
LKVMKYILISYVIFLVYAVGTESFSDKSTTNVQINSSSNEYSHHPIKKVYLKDLLEKFEDDYEELQYEAFNTVSSSKDNHERDACRLRMLEISIYVEDCGKITMNTTKCDGYCKSITTVIPNTKMQKNFCYACKSHEFEFASYQIKCLDGKIKLLKLKKVKACTCFKHSERINPIHNVKEKNFF